MNNYIEMAKEIEDLLDEGEDFNEALDKVSKEHGLNPDEIEELVETYEDNYLPSYADDIDIEEGLFEEDIAEEDDFFEEDID